MEPKSYKQIGQIHNLTNQSLFIINMYKNLKLNKQI